MKINKALLLSYGRHLGGIVFGAIVTVATLTNRDVFTFTQADWLVVANSVWVAVLPLLKRFFSKKFPDFGVGAKP